MTCIWWYLRPRYKRSHWLSWKDTGALVTKRCQFQRTPSARIDGSWGLTSVDRTTVPGASRCSTLRTVCMLLDIVMWLWPSHQPWFTAWSLRPRGRLQWDITTIICSYLCSISFVFMPTSSLVSPSTSIGHAGFKSKFLQTPVTVEFRNLPFQMNWTWRRNMVVKTAHSLSKVMLFQIETFSYVCEVLRAHFLNQQRSPN